MNKVWLTLIYGDEYLRELVGEERFGQLPEVQFDQVGYVVGGVALIASVA